VEQLDFLSQALNGLKSDSMSLHEVQKNPKQAGQGRADGVNGQPQISRYLEAAHETGETVGEDGEGDGEQPGAEGQ
jgi:hypothetical protein